MTQEELTGWEKGMDDLRGRRPPGPWVDEPSRLNWRAFELDCMMIRNHSFVWCGYVGVPKGHPLFGKSYHDVELDAHGGLTYASPCRGHICHITDDPNDETWWFGFDCAHGGDLIPGMIEVHEKINKEMASKSVSPDRFSRIFNRHEHYWTTDDVKKEVENLAKRIHGTPADELLRKDVDE